MKMKLLVITGLVAFLSLSLTERIPAAGLYDSLEGSESIKAVFDVRNANPRVAALQIDLIHRTFADPAIRAVTPGPEFAVIFAGGATKLISTDTEGYTPEDKEYMAQIVATVAAMAREGIRLEACMFAANVMDVRPDSILPGIKQVPNGWISLIGYQDRGYRLIGVY